jgi:hypothetical protein
MGHNVSTSKRASAALRLPLADFGGWRLAVECGSRGCAIGRAYDVTQLSHFYSGLTVFQAINRMRCSACQKPPCEARLKPGPSMPRIAREIPLKGSGSV